MDLNLKTHHRGRDVNTLNLEHFLSALALCLLCNAYASTASAAEAAPADAAITHSDSRDSKDVTPRKEAGTPQETRDLYSVSVRRVSAQELLLAMARDAGLNADIHPDINDRISITATGLTFPEVVERVARQTGLRYTLTEQDLIVTPDFPYLKTYPVDYANLSRDSSSVVSLASQIGSLEDTKSGSASKPLPQQGGSGSFARIQNTSNNRFWTSLVRHLGEVLVASAMPGSADCRGANEESNAASAPEESRSGCIGAGRKPPVVSANVEAGVITVVGTDAQHRQAGKLIEQILARASRQVIIEATIAEVELSSSYQQGIDWSSLNLFGTGLRYIQRPPGVFLGTNSTPAAELGYTSASGNFSAAVRLLQTFGEVRVLSSPKLSVMHNQTAVMKIVDDNIYFTYEIKETDPSSTTPGKRTLQSTLHSVPVGFVLAITPMIGDDNSVTLNIRPSMSRVIGQKTDPSLEFIAGESKVTNTIPVIRAREFESVLRIENGSVAIMGGLMDDSVDNIRSEVPGMAALPLIGHLFRSRNDTIRKTELVILVRPTVIPAGAPVRSGGAHHVRWLA